jgi:hypothetical protein
VAKSNTLSPSERSLRARKGALEMLAKHDPKETSARGREAFLSRFEREVDPDGTLPPEERARRAEYAKRAYFTGLAYKSARARAKRGGGDG